MSVVRVWWWVGWWWEVGVGVRAPVGVREVCKEWWEGGWAGW
jgi:hypothetical protein